MNDDFIEITSDDGEVTKMDRQLMYHFLQCLCGVVFMFVYGVWALVDYLI